LIVALLSGITAAVSTAVPARAAVTAHTEHVAHVAHTQAIQQAREMKAQQAAIASATSACSGSISPDTMYSCTSPLSTGTDTYTLTVSQVPNALMIRAQGSGTENPVFLTAPDGTRISCSGYCQVSQTGTYSVAVTNYDASYTLEYSDLLSESNCPAVDTSYSASVTSGSLAKGQDGACYVLNMPSGDVLHSVTDLPYGGLTVYDSTGAQVCSAGSGTNGTGSTDCTLTGTGPYRAWVTSDSSGIAENFQMQLYDITSPSGCQATAQVTFGQTPALSTDQCRTLTVSTAGKYRIDLYQATNLYSQAAKLYDQTGTKVTCDQSTGGCQLAAGTYDLIQDNLANPSFSVSFMASDETRGCTTTNDTGFTSGAVTGTIAGGGTEDCLTLPDASGQSVYRFNQPSSAGAAIPGVTIVDATGADQCSGDNSGGTCTLTGTAPFRVTITNSTANSESYRVIIQNTATVNCPTWTQSAYGSSAGATATLTATNDVQCYTIPAAQHASEELVQSAASAGQLTTGVYDSAGNNVCGTHSICSFQSGQSYTALVQDSSAATVNIARRDVTQTATCASPSSTTVGTSTRFTLDSAVAAECYRVTPAATDKLMAQDSTIGMSHSLASDPDSSIMLVTDASGTVVCQDNCKLTGDTDYQVIVEPSTTLYDGVNTRVSLDIWTLETASGIAPQCAANQLTATNGWMVSGNLTDSDSAYCAEVKIQPSQTFGFFTAGTGPSAAVSRPLGDVYMPDDWSGNGSLTGICGGTVAGANAIQCDTSSSEASTTALMVVDASPSALGGFSAQGVCWAGGCTQTPATPTLKSVSPASGAGPANTVTVTGTGLNLGDQISLGGGPSNGTGADAVTRNESVNAAGTSLTFSLDTGSLVAGKYNVQLDAPVANQSTGAVSTLSSAYTISSAPPTSGFTPVTQTQIMSGSLAKGSTTNVGVGGHGGVPSSGATSAKLAITVTNPSTAGSITVYPGNKSKPSTTALNFAAGQTQTDMVDVQLGSGVELYNGAGGALNVTVDTIGYYSSGGASYTPLSQARILNSTSVASKTTKEIQVGGNGGVPSSGASSVALEVTESGAGAAGSAVVYPNGGTRPADADLSFAKGQTVTDLAIGKLGTGLLLYNNSGSAANFTVDVVGYYSGSGSKFHPLTPDRILDTRNAIGGNGDQGVPSKSDAVTTVWSAAGVPGNATAVVVDVTALSPQDAGTLTAYADCDGAPFDQSMAFTAGSGSKATSQVIIPVYSSTQHPSGAIDVFNNSGGTVQIVGDIEGYYS